MTIHGRIFDLQAVFMPKKWVKISQIRGTLPFPMLKAVQFIMSN